MKNILEKLSFLIIRMITFDYYVIKREINLYRGSKRKVLDLGSGNGYLCKYFNKNGYEGHELSEFLVKRAKTDYPKYNFFQSDITLLNLRKKFDLVLVIGVIHHLNDHNFNKLLNVLDKHLLQDGKIFIIEAIPPISRYNITGKILRELDNGEYVRKTESYKKKLSKKFKVDIAKELKGGLVDYALFIVTKQNS